MKIFRKLSVKLIRIVASIGISIIALIFLLGFLHNIYKYGGIYLNSHEHFWFSLSTFFPETIIIQLSILLIFNWRVVKKMQYNFYSIITGLIISGIVSLILLRLAQALHQAYDDVVFGQVSRSNSYGSNQNRVNTNTSVNGKWFDSQGYTLDIYDDNTFNAVQKDKTTSKQALYGGTYRKEGDTIILEYQSGNNLEYNLVGSTLSGYDNNSTFTKSDLVIPEIETGMEWGARSNTGGVIQIGSDGEIRARHELDDGTLLGKYKTNKNYLEIQFEGINHKSLYEIFEIEGEMIIANHNSNAVFVKLDQELVDDTNNNAISRAYTNMLNKKVGFNSVTSNTSLIKAIQEQLSLEGFNPGVIDGIYGPNTDGALERYRSAYNIGQFNKLGTITLLHLIASTMKQSESQPSTYSIKPKQEISIISQPNLNSEKPKQRTSTVFQVNNPTNADQDASCKDRFGLYSNYDSIENQCECIRGYGPINNECVSLDQYCKSEQGPGSTYNSTFNNCECINGYWFIDGQCLDANTVCKSEKGMWAEYDSFNNTCACGYGYILYEGSCQSGNTICNSKYGWRSSYDSMSKQCDCGYGAEIYNGQCMTMDEICKDKYGWSYRYDSFERACVD